VARSLRGHDGQEPITSGFPGLSPAEFHRHTETAQRFLASAYDSVDELLLTVAMFRALRREEGLSLRGRLRRNEEDLLRAAILFAGAGLDAVLKQLIRDALPHLIEVNTQSHGKFEEYASNALMDGTQVSSRRVAALLVSRNPRAALVERYIESLTGPSLQSAEQVSGVASALGVSQPELRRRIHGLRPLFIARNQIAHELDLRRPEQSSDKHRRPRRLEESTSLAHEGLEVGQLLVNEVVKLLT
jgi:hypothetical protein